MKNRFTYSFLALVVTVFLLNGCGHNGKKKVNKKRDRAEVMYQLGVEYYKEGRLIDALEGVTEAYDRYPKDPNYNYMLGVVYYAKEMPQRAIKHLEIAIENYEGKYTFSEAHTKLSNVYLYTKNWDKAIASSKMALDNIFYRKAEKALTNIGWAYFNKTEYKRALTYFQKALKVNNRFVLAHNYMGLTYERLSLKKDAQISYRKALRFAPNYVEANYNLAVLLVKVKDKEEAVKLFEKVLRLAPESDLAKSSREYLDLLK